MSDIMTCMPFGQLMDWVLQEKKGSDTVFGVHRTYVADAKNNMTIFGRALETPVGPAAAFRSASSPRRAGSSSGSHSPSPDPEGPESTSEARWLHFQNTCLLWLDCLKWRM